MSLLMTTRTALAEYKRALHPNGDISNAYIAQEVMQQLMDAIVQHRRVFPGQRELTFLYKLTKHRYTFCADCSKLILIENGRITDDDTYVCDDCGNEFYEYYDDGNVWRRREDTWDEPSESIQGYRANPLDQLSGFYHNRNEIGKHSTRYFGVELEVECIGNREAGARTIAHTIRDFAIIKSDGSVDNGFEICTVPCTLLYHQTGIDKQSKSPWDNLLNYLENEHEYVTDNARSCGMHVHISRESITPITLCKLLKFFDSAANSEFIEKIARRPINNRWARQQFLSTKELLVTTGDRYSVINLTNPYTIEFRIFASTSSKSKLLTGIEFCDAITNWASEVSLSQLSYTKFLDWMLTNPRNRRLYKNLFDYLIDTDYLDGRMLRKHRT